MANKFRGIEQLPAGEDTARPVQMGLDGGYRGDVSPREIPPDSSPELGDVRFERRAIRKDFGWSPIGAAAGFPVIGLIEHKYIDGQLQFHRLVRFYIDGGGNLALEVWDGVNWVLTDTSTEIVSAAYLSMVSALGCLYAANGEFVFRWCEELEKFDQENDFPAFGSASLLAPSLATVSPGDPVVLEYTINYDVTIDGNFDGSFPPDTVVVVEFFHETTSLGEREYIVTAAQGVVSFEDEAFSFNRQIDDMDEVSIHVKSVTGGLSQDVTDLFLAGATLDREVAKSVSVPADNDEYEFSFLLSTAAGCTAEVGVYVDVGAGFVLVSTISTVNGGTFPVTIPDLGGGVTFALNIDNVTGGGCGPGDSSFVGGSQVDYTTRLLIMSVHGHNKATQGDDPAGVTYQTTGGIVSVFEPIDPGPGGRFLEFFARRLVVLRNFADSQFLAFSVDGILDDFTGTGSGELVLIEARSDPIDDLMGTAVLNSNFMALFRRRSIMRVFETGNVDLALGVVSWLENIGTESPFSIQLVRGGAIFLGHDLMFYYLTEQGPTPIGESIHQDLIETLTGNVDLVDSVYDPVFSQYIVGVPENGASEITKEWIFDLEEFFIKQRLVWRSRPKAVQRYAIASEVE